MTFIASRLRSAMTPRIRERVLAAGEAGPKGALLAVDVDGKYAEAAVDAVEINAIALSAFGTSTSGFEHLGVHEFPPGYMQGVLVKDLQKFHAEYTGALPAATGGDYGLALNADNEVIVDFGNVATPRVRLTSMDLADSTFSGRRRVEVFFLPDYVQLTD